MSKDLQNEPKTKQPNALFDLDLPTKRDDLIESLQSQLTAEIDGRREERWIWLVSLMLMFDAFTFSAMSTWSGPVAIGTIQFVVIIALGRRWQMDPVWTLTERILDKWNGKLKG